ncbi:MAG: Two-component response regulator [Bacteroidetes bacterium]|jgi:CheY-like chemotaxis protein|nr:Two-component response regulator [Bacteroidota bacterium]
MGKKLNRVLLIDDDESTNFLHKIVLEDNVEIKNIEVAETVTEAFEILERSKGADKTEPDLIFLDLNMPGMNGWDFLEKYKGLHKNSLIFILTTSANPDDKKKAEKIKEVSGFRNKPLTGEMVQEIILEYFPH